MAKAKRICSFIWPGSLEDDPLPNSVPFVAVA